MGVAKKFLYLLSLSEAGVELGKPIYEFWGFHQGGENDWS